MWPLDESARKPPACAHHAFARMGPKKATRHERGTYHRFYKPAVFHPLSTQLRTSQLRPTRSKLSPLLSIRSTRPQVYATLTSIKLQSHSLQYITMRAPKHASKRPASFERLSGGLTLTCRNHARSGMRPRPGSPVTYAFKKLL